MNVKSAVELANLLRDQEAGPRRAAP
jgi:hypothetical protein